MNKDFIRNSVYYSENLSIYWGNNKKCEVFIIIAYSMTVPLHEIHLLQELYFRKVL
jgi:hypothetical protein